MIKRPRIKLAAANQWNQPSYKCPLVQTDIFWRRPTRWTGIYWCRCFNRHPGASGASSGAHDVAHEARRCHLWCTRRSCCCIIFVKPKPALWALAVALFGRVSRWSTVWQEPQDNDRKVARDRSMWGKRSSKVWRGSRVRQAGLVATKTNLVD